MFLTAQSDNEGDHHNFAIADVLERYGWDGIERGYTAWRKVSCPFHVDRTPSGALNHELNSYRCFSCDASGNSVTLVMKQEGLAQDAAVEWLKSEVDAQPSERPAKRNKLPWEPGWW